MLLLQTFLLHHVPAREAQVHEERCSSFWPLATLMGCFEGEFIRREKAACCHNGIALSLFVIFCIEGAHLRYSALFQMIGFCLPPSTTDYCNVWACIPPSPITECCRAHPPFELLQFAPGLCMTTHNFSLITSSFKFLPPNRPAPTYSFRGPFSDDADATDDPVDCSIIRKMIRGNAVANLPNIF